jgi:hypothetical protein
VFSTYTQLTVHRAVCFRRCNRDYEKAKKAIIEVSVYHNICTINIRVPPEYCAEVFEYSIAGGECRPIIHYDKNFSSVLGSLRLLEAIVKHVKLDVGAQETRAHYEVACQSHDTTSDPPQCEVSDSDVRLAEEIEGMLQD